MRGKQLGAGWFVVLMLAGVAVIATALISAGGDLGAFITVRGGGAPAYVIVSVGAAMAIGGAIGSAWRRE